MKITAVDIHSQGFRKRFRGYDRDEVESFLEAIAKSFEELTRENHELSEQIQRLEDQVEEHRRKEQSIYEALLQAHQYGEEAKGTAERESELILREAKFEADNIIRQAEDKADGIRQEIMILQHEKERFITEYRALLHVQLKMLAKKEQQTAIQYGNTEVAKGLNEITILESSNG
ncbi:MAG: DivIVA domain-containing protein [Candidatus Poribacteria bacterium]|nr:DivIVA domain-containing protein [Candidatus Poribacteria bacterium]